jgi:hypothetical protein
VAHDHRSALGRSGFLGAAGTLTVASLLTGANSEGSSLAAATRGAAAGQSKGRRMQMAHMVENTGAMGVQLTPAEADELNAAVRAIEVQGARLPEFVQRMSDVEAPPKN